MRTFIEHVLILSRVPGTMPGKDDTGDMAHSKHGRVSLASTQVEYCGSIVVEVGTISQNHSRERPQPSLEGPGRQR